MLLPLIATTWMGLAQAQVVTAVPPGARAVTVLLCERDDGCVNEARALGVHASEQGQPVLDFDRVMAQGPSQGDALLRFGAAMEPVRAGAASLAELERARTRLGELRLSVPEADLFALWMGLALARLADGATQDADAAFAAAASVSQGRVHDLPPMSDAALGAYMDAVDRSAGEPATIAVNAPATGARVFLDGRPMGDAPVELQVRPGWHRVSVERAGRTTAWVGELTGVAGRRSEVQADVGVDDGVAAAEAAIAAQTRRGDAPPEVVAAMRQWGQDQGLDYVRFVRLVQVDTEAIQAPEERISDPNADHPGWNVYAAWLDVDQGRFVDPGPSLSVLRDVDSRTRLRVSIGLGYLHLAPRDHVLTELGLLVRLSDRLALDARVGAMRTGEPYYLYTNWIDQTVYPLTLGVRYGDRSGGPYAGAAALAVVPFALGGVAFAGWDLAPSPRWRLGLEARGGATDAGWTAGGIASFGWAG